LGTAAEVLKGHEDAAVGVLFGSTGDMLVSSSWDGTARIWHPTGRQLARMPASEVFLGRDGRLAVRHGTRLAIVKVAQGPEYRSLYDRGARVPVRLLAIDPHSRVLLSAGETRLHLWDLETGNILERLRGAVHSVQFAADGRHVLTAGPTDMHRWPVHWDADVARLRLGPPERVAAQVPRPLRWSALSSGAGALVVPAGAHDALVVDCKTGAVKCRLADHTNISCAAVSPDGRWLATGSWHGVEARVWDADNGALLRRFPHAIGIGHSFVGFSPDGKWLALCFGSEYQLVEVGVWEVRRRLARDQVVELPGPACFSPDGRLLAMTRTPHVVKLVDADTGDEVATLSLPQTATLTLMCFSQDGSRLVAGGSDAIHVWDLRRIRERLADMGLDWNAPALVEDQQPRKPVHLELDLGALAPARK
jgi:WD40 repeat protein